MQVKVGDIVKLRDGRVVAVTEASSLDPDDYRWYAADGETINDELPVETIFMGNLVDTRPRGWSKGKPRLVVSDMSEVVSILE